MADVDPVDDAVDRGVEVAAGLVESVGPARAASILAVAASVAAVAVAVAYGDDLDEVINDVCGIVRRTAGCVVVARPDTEV